jgi:hypothetical protein
MKNLVWTTSLDLEGHGITHMLRETNKPASVFLRTAGKARLVQLAARWFPGMEVMARCRSNSRRCLGDRIFTNNHGSRGSAACVVNVSLTPHACGTERLGGASWGISSIASAPIAAQVEFRDRLFMSLCTLLSVRSNATAPHAKTMERHDSSRRRAGKQGQVGGNSQTNSQQTITTRQGANCHALERANLGSAG